MEGWVKMHHKVLSEPYFKNERMLKVWVWLMLKATYTEYEALVGLETVTLKPGQLVFGLDRATAELEIPRATLYRLIKSLEKQGVITIKAGRRFSIITLTEWGVTQQGERYSRDADEMPKRPYKKEKKEKKEKKSYIPSDKIQYATFVFMTAEQYAALQERFGAEDAERLIEILNNHKGATGKTYQEDYYAILSWCVKTLQDEKSAPTAKSGKRNKFINYTDENADFSQIPARSRPQTKISSA